MKLNLLAGAALLLAVFSGNAMAAPPAPFSLKGVTIGMSPGEACAGAHLENEYGDKFGPYKERSQRLVDMETAECWVQYPSFGGVQLKHPAKLTFLDGALIQFELDIERLPASDAAAFSKAFAREYGKPRRTGGGTVAAETWKRPGQTLIFERVRNEWDDIEVAIILRDDAGFRTFKKRRQINDAEIRRLDAPDPMKDMR